MTQNQLEDAVVDDHDLPGVTANEIGEGTDGLGNGVIKAFPSSITHPAVCAPVRDTLEGASGYGPVGSVQRTAGTPGHSAILTLVSYRPADAVRVLADLRTALRTCTAYAVDLPTVAYEDVKAVDDPAQGENSVAFGLTTVMNADSDPLRVAVGVLVKRHGSTVAVYKSTADRPGKPAKLPADLIAAQTKVLDAAVRGH
ncbi:hypothetical protein [Streptomyces sp. NBC_00370]|uniref:hypothetical protein n=1 Tax=Streptomyces sp. NBC_00370 TaxID=2975728 RepID=UPI002E25CD04